MLWHEKAQHHYYKYQTITIKRYIVHIDCKDIKIASYYKNKRRLIYSKRHFPAFYSTFPPFPDAFSVPKHHIRQANLFRTFYAKTDDFAPIATWRRLSYCHYFQPFTDILLSGKALRFSLKKKIPPSERCPFAWVADSQGQFICMLTIPKEHQTVQKGVCGYAFSVILNTSEKWFLMTCGQKNGSHNI